MPGALVRRYAQDERVDGPVATYGRGLPALRGSGMPSADIVEQVRELAARVAGTYGLDIFDVQFRREASGMVLRIRLDRPGPAATAEEPSATGRD